MLHGGALIALVAVGMDVDGGPWLVSQEVDVAGESRFGLSASGYRSRRNMTTGVLGRLGSVELHVPSPLAASR